MSRVAWVDGPAEGVLDRLVIEAAGCWRALVARSERWPGSGAAGRVLVAGRQDRPTEVLITLEGPVIGTIDLSGLRGMWNGAGDLNRALLAAHLDGAAATALALMSPSAATIAAADIEEDLGDETDVDGLLASMVDGADGVDLRVLVEQPWLASVVSLSRPDLARAVAHALVPAWHALDWVPLATLLDSLGRVAAGSAWHGRVHDAEDVLILGWRVFAEYQTTQATSDWCLVGDRIAPLLVAWSTVDVGALALAGMLASDTWAVSVTQPAMPGAAFLCRPRAM